MTAKEFNNILSQHQTLSMSKALSTADESYIYQDLFYHFESKSNTVQVGGKIPYSFIERLKDDKRIISIPSKSYTSNEQMIKYIKNATNTLWIERSMKLEQMREYYLTYFPEKIFYSVVILDDVLALMIWLKEWNKFYQENKDILEKEKVKSKKL